MGLFDRRKKDNDSKDGSKNPMGLEDLPPVPPLKKTEKTKEENKIKEEIKKEVSKPEPIEKKEYYEPINEETVKETIETSTVNQDYYSPDHEETVKETAKAPEALPEEVFKINTVPDALPDLSIPVPAELDSIPFFDDARIEKLPKLYTTKKNLKEYKILK